MQDEPLRGTSRLTPWIKSIATTVGILAFSLLSWWLIADPEWAVVDLYPQPLGTLLFWTILGVVYVAFNFKLWPLVDSGRPGLAVFLFVASTLVIGFAAVGLVNFGLGRLDPTFAGSAPGGAGYAASAFIVLIGFLVWPMMSAVWDDWPWRDAGLSCPLLGVAQFVTGLSITAVGYLLLIYPNFAPWGGPDNAENVLVPLNLAVGWFYSVIVAMILATQLWGNWPWSSFRHRWQQALGSVPTLFLLGTGIFFVVRWLVLPALVPADIRALPAWAGDLEVAQFGVCIVMWSLFWNLIFGSRPTHFGEGTNRVVRTAAVLILSVATYLIYTRYLGTQVLHEPALSGAYGGNLLLGLDWVILVVLWYALGLDLYRSLRSAKTGRDAEQTLPAPPPVGAPGGATG